MNASFLKFYGSILLLIPLSRHAHLHNPVKFTGPDPDDDFSTMTGDIEPETWPAFAPQLPHGMIYNVIYGQKIYREQPENLRDSWYCQWYGNLSYFQKDWRKMGTDQTEYVAF